MSMLDALVKNPQMIGDVAKFAKDNPEIAKAALSMLRSGGDGGGSSGLSGVLGALRSKGLGDVVSSWVSTGENRSISPEQLQSALGQDKLSRLAQQAGVSGSEASAALAGMLPGLVDKLSPDGKLPDSKGIESMIGQILSRD